MDDVTQMLIYSIMSTILSIIFGTQKNIFFFLKNSISFIDIAEPSTMTLSVHSYPKNLVAFCTQRFVSSFKIRYSLVFFFALLRLLSKYQICHSRPSMPVG